MNRTKFITLAGMSIALVYVFTAFINVKLPLAAQGGLIHLGNVPLFIFAFLYGRKIGAIAGALGMGLFDLLSGWTMWAPFTFIIVGAMGYLIGSIAEKHHGMGWYSLALVLACLLKVSGYYIAEGIIYGNWLAPLSSIPGNLCQIGIAAIIALPVVSILRRQMSSILC